MPTRLISTIKQPSRDSVEDFLDAIQKRLGADYPPGRLQGYRVDIPLSTGRMDPAFTPVGLNFFPPLHPLTVLLVGRKLHGRNTHGTRPKPRRLFPAVQIVKAVLGHKRLAQQDFIPETTITVEVCSTGLIRFIAINSGYSSPGMGFIDALYIWL